MPAIAFAIYLIATTGLTVGAAYAAVFEALVMISAYIAYQSAKGGMDRSLSDNGILTNTQSSDEPIPILYGRHRVGGNMVYRSSTGENNKFIHTIMTLSEGPIEGIETLYLDDKPSTDYGGLVYYEFFNGDGNQGVCTTLQAADPAWNDNMRWTAYLYVRLEYDPNKFTSFPKLTVIAKGRKLYDPRTGNTAYANTLALAAYDFLTNKRYGLGSPVSLVDLQSIIDATNWYESQYFVQTAWLASTVYAVGARIVPSVNNKQYLYECTVAGTSGATAPAWPGAPGRTVTDGTVTWRSVENTYTFNGVIGTRQTFLDNFVAMLRNGRVDILWSGGKYKFLVRKYDTPIMSLNENEIVADSFTFNVPGLTDTPNRIVIRYPDEARQDPKDMGWLAKEQIIEDGNAVLQYDNEERDSTLELIGTTNSVQANLLGVYALERAGLNKTHSFTAGPRAFILEPGDMIQVTHTLPGWTNRVVRVLDVSIQQSGLVVLTVVEEDAALYNATLDLSAHTYFNTTLPDPLAVVPEATGISFIEEEYFNKDTSYTRLKVTFVSPTSPLWYESAVYVNINGAGYAHYTNTRMGFSIEPVVEGANYKVKFVSVSINARRGDIATATEWSYTVVGKNTPPSDVTNFRAIPLNDSITLMWDPVNALDLAGYEIRKGINWSGGIYLSSPQGISYVMTAVAPGTHSFMIKSVDTKGKYSINYALATCTVYGPTFYTEKMSEFNDFQAPAVRVNSTAYVLGNKVSPSTANGFYYICIAAGTSGAAAPTWPTANGGTVADGTVTWKALEAQVFTNCESYYDAVAGWELRNIHDSDEFVTTQDLKAGGDGVKQAGWNVLNSASADVININKALVELLTNGGFESGVISPFWGSVGGTGAATFPIDNVGAYAGTYCLHATITNGGTAENHVQAGSANISLLKGFNYTVTFAARAASARTVKVVVQQGVTPFANYGLTQTVNLTTFWQVFSFTFTSTVNASDAQIIFGLGNQGAIDVYLDAISSKMITEGVLTIDLNAVASVAAGVTFTAPWVYKLISGDFDVETYLSSTNSQAMYEQAYLMARDPAASVGEDALYMGYGWNSTLNLTCTRNTVNSVDTAAEVPGVTDKYFRITRAGSVFTCYSKATPTGIWVQRAQFTRADFGTTIQVGLGAFPSNVANTYAVQFDYFRKVGGILSSTYLSPVYDRGSNITRRSWLNFDYLFEGTGVAWYDQFLPANLWTDKYAAADMWLKLFGVASTGNIKIWLGTSTDGATWSWMPQFESLAIEMQTKYVRYKSVITDVDVAGYLHKKACTYKEAY